MAKGHIQRSPWEGKALGGFLAKGHIQHSQGYRPWNLNNNEHVWPKAMFNPYAKRGWHLMMLDEHTFVGDVWSSGTLGACKLDEFNLPCL